MAFFYSDYIDVPVIEAPNLKYLYMQHFIANQGLIRDISQVFVFKAPKLQTLDLSFNGIRGVNEDWAAFLSSMPLTHLDLSSNEIHLVQDTFLNEMKYLNLSYNQIEATDYYCEPVPCGVTHFKNLSKLEVLSLRSLPWVMHFIPESLLSQYDHPFLHTLEWTGCIARDCDAQAIQIFLLTDKIVYLKSYTNNINKQDERVWNYICYSGDHSSTDGFSLTAVMLDCTIDLSF